MVSKQFPGRTSRKDYDSKPDGHSHVAGWVSAETSRFAARKNAVLRHPLMAATFFLRGKRKSLPTVAVPENATDILTKLNDLPISVWTYGFDPPSVRHLGPMAQDFYRAFGLGRSDRRIDLLDSNGVALASIQALSRRLAALERQVSELKTAQAGLRDEREPNR